MAVSDKEEMEWLRERSEFWKEATMDYKWLVVQYARLLQEVTNPKIVVRDDGSKDDEPIKPGRVRWL